MLQRKTSLTWLGVVGGAVILAAHSFSGHALNDDAMDPAVMTGSTLSALHAAIPAESGSRETAPTF